jgi:hypothetical protein
MRLVSENTVIIFCEHVQALLESSITTTHQKKMLSENSVAGY